MDETLYKEIAQIMNKIIKDRTAHGEVYVVPLIIEALKEYFKDYEIYRRDTRD